MLEMAIADFYAVNEAGLVRVQVVGDDYYIIETSAPHDEVISSTTI